MRHSGPAPLTTVPSAAPYPPYAFEGYDASGLPSYRGRSSSLPDGQAQGESAGEFLQCGARRHQRFKQFRIAGRIAAFFASPTAYDMDPVAGLPFATLTVPYPPPPGQPQNQAFYNSQWAEVLYYLVRSGSTEEPNNPKSVLGTPTYSLTAANFVMVPDATNLAGKISGGLRSTLFAGMSCGVVRAR